MITFGEQFIRSAYVLRIIAWTLLFIGLNHVVSTFLIVTDHQKDLLKIRLIVNLVYLIVSLLLIWKYSYVGLAWAILTIEALLFITTFIFAHKSVFELNFTKTSLVPISSCLFSMILFAFVSNLPAWITVPLVLSVYSLGMIVLKGISLNDFVFLKSIFSGDESR